MIQDSLKKNIHYYNLKRKKKKISNPFGQVKVNKPNSHGMIN